MRKILFVFVITALVFVIYGCKPSLPDELYGCVEYLEKLKLRGQSADFFVEVILGKCRYENFCKIILIPTNLNSPINNLDYMYGDKEGRFEKDLTTEQYIAIFDYDKTHSSLYLNTSQGIEEVFLTPLSLELPAKQLLLQAYTHFEDILYQEFKSKKPKHKIYLKILADMSGNAFYYVGFIGKDNFLAALFNIDTQEIVADYVR